MKTLFFLISAILLNSCAPLDSSSNPLDRPQEKAPTVEQLHGQNLSDITGNPTFDKTIEIE